MTHDEVYALLVAGIADALQALRESPDPVDRARVAQMDQAFADLEEALASGGGGGG